MSLDSQTPVIEPLSADNCQLVDLGPTHKRLTRDAAIDFTKGTLVLFMVLYHWLNYFVGPYGRYYNYLRFLTPSFIFISGFMISRVHLSRYENSGRQLAARLTVRGIKLFAVVFLLNALISFAPALFGPRPATMAKSLQNICWSFIVANPTASQGQKGVAFSMLVPIAYLLMLSAVLVVLAKRKRHAFYYTLLLLSVAVALSYAYGKVSSYLDLLLIGVLGVVIGFAKREHIAVVLGHSYVLILLYCCYLAVITVCDVTLPLQIASVILTTALLYIVGSRESHGAAWRCTVLLGKYSLLGYISQIAMLQALRRVSWFFQHGVGILLVSLVLGTLLTLVIVEVADFSRRRSSLADGLYRLVFT